MPGTTGTVAVPAGRPVAAVAPVGALRAIAVRVAAEQRERLLQRQLRDASHQSGMAEVATGVLHNVGNVLNSVNVSASARARCVIIR